MFPDKQQIANQTMGVAGDPAMQQANPQAQMQQAVQMIGQQIEQLQMQIAQIQAEIAQNQGRDLNLLNARSQMWVQEIMSRNDEERLRGR